MLNRGTKKPHEFAELALSHTQVSGLWPSVVSNLHYMYSIGAKCNVHKLCYEMPRTYIQPNKDRHHYCKLTFLLFYQFIF